MNLDDDFYFFLNKKEVIILIIWYWNFGKGKNNEQNLSDYADSSFGKV